MWRIGAVMRWRCSFPRGQACLCVIATLVVGLVPALQSGKIDLAGALKSDSAGVVGSHGRAWVRSGLVVMQVSLSFVLLVGAGLLLQSLQRIRNSSPGFSTHGVLSTAVDLVSAGYDAQRAKNFQDELMDRVKALPGVESAVFARATPLGYGSYSESPIAVDGYQPPPEEQPTVVQRSRAGLFRDDGDSAGVGAGVHARRR